MKINILTIFPELFAAFREYSIIGRAVSAGLIDIEAVNIRDYTQDKHRRTDDYPFGGGAGMVMTCQPVFDCFADVCRGSSGKSLNIYMSPAGRPLSPALARELAEYDTLNVLCGHYEGIDQRIIDELIDLEVSIGDYVVTGGEVPAMVLADCIVRFIPGALGNELSAEDESFSDGALEYPQYTRPADYNGLLVPEVLLSGHHANIEKWRREQSKRITAARRPDLVHSGKNSEN